MRMKMVADPQGRFEIANLQPGSYSVSVAGDRKPDLRGLRVTLAGGEKETSATERRLVRLIEDTSQSLQSEMHAGLAAANARLDVTDRRLERIDSTINAVNMQMTGISRSLGQTERADVEHSTTAAAQQHAIDQLAAHVSRLEERLGR